MASYQLILAYYKQGDDLDDAIREVLNIPRADEAEPAPTPNETDAAANATTRSGTDTDTDDLNGYFRAHDVNAAQSAQAFLKHAERMKYVEQQLRQAATFAAENGLRIAFADTHCIFVELEDDALAARLIQEGVLIPDDDGDAEGEDDDEGVDDDDDDDDDDDNDAEGEDDDDDDADTDADAEGVDNEDEGDNEAGAAGGEVGP